jgi:hypothetical protein
LFRECAYPDLGIGFSTQTRRNSKWFKMFYFLQMSLDVNGLNLNSDVAIYPNPANREARIVFPCIIQSGTIRIYNNFGQTVKQESFSNKQQYFIGSFGTRSFYYYVPSRRASST